MKKVLGNIVMIWLTMSIVCFFYRDYIAAMYNWSEKYLFSCTDFGQYITDTESYNTEGISLQNTVEVGREPGFFLITSTLQRVIQINNSDVLILATGLVYVLTILMWLCFIRRTDKREWIWILSIILFGLAFIEVHAFTFQNSRQLLGNLFLYNLIYLLIFFPKKIYVNGIILWGALLAHRLSMLAALVIIFSTGVYFFFFDKKKFTLTIKILVIWLFTTLPNLYLNLWSFIDTFLWYKDIWTWKSTGVGESSARKTNTLLWWSWITRSSSGEENPLFLYIKLVPVIFAISISQIWKNIILKKKWIYMPLIMATIYCLIHIGGKVIFANRVLITFEWFLIVILVCSIGGIFTKQAKSILVGILIIYCFILIKSDGNAISRKTIFYAENDASIRFLKSQKNIDSYYFGSHCTSDLLWQLGLPSAYNFIKTPVINVQKEDEINYYTFADISYKSGLELVDQPYVHDILKWKNIYVVFSEKLWDKKEVTNFKKKIQNYIVNKDVKIIFKGSGDETISYVLEINQEKVLYYDTLNYFRKNRKN